MPVVTRIGPPVKGTFPGKMRKQNKNKKVRNLLELVPERKRDFKELSDGTVEIIIPRYGDTAVGRVIERFLKSSPVKVKLDKIGAFTWHLCDGEHSVQAIGERLEEAFGASVDPLYERLGLFFKQMERRGLIDWKK